MKACRDCGTVKPVTEFYAMTRCGLTPNCKACILADRKRRYASDRDGLRTRILARASTPTGAFDIQRKAAAARGIEWALTFDEWWAIWRESRKWSERGCRRGQYVMARRGDVGPYSPANVYICSASENCSDGRQLALSRKKNLAEVGITNRYERKPGDSTPFV